MIRPMGVPAGGVASILPFIERVLRQNVIESRSEELNSVMSQIHGALQPFMSDNAAPTLGAPTPPDILQARMGLPPMDLGGPRISSANPLNLEPGVPKQLFGGGNYNTPPTASAGGALGTTATMARPAYFPMDEDGDGIDQFNRPMREPMEGRDPMDFAKSFGRPAPTFNSAPFQTATPGMQIPGIAGLPAIFRR